MLLWSWTTRTLSVTVVPKITLAMVLQKSWEEHLVGQCSLSRAEVPRHSPMFVCLAFTPSSGFSPLSGLYLLPGSSPSSVILSVIKIYIQPTCSNHVAGFCFRAQKLSFAYPSPPPPPNTHRYMPNYPNYLLPVFTTKLLNVLPSPKVLHKALDRKDNILACPEIAWTEPLIESSAWTAWSSSPFFWCS